MADLSLRPWMYFILPHQGSVGDCTAFVFLFGSINVQNTAWLTFCKVFSVIGCVLAFLLIWRFAWSAIVDSGLLKKFLDRRKHASLVEHPESGTRSTKANRVTDIIKLAALALVGIGSIVFVEEVIRINRIDLSEAPLDRSSQLIPLLVALFNLLPILWGLVKARFLEK
ncbi:hypothetical protein PRZ48_005390 [Zasmidium cellare]|uniref:Uncharacterized protein n=1 Tax=Zasmidium cellare TaxID=395010 RepID=A0ABR0ESA5_ZASCE|nr:hypothetical protein PRZ48_005390 [Zasmidium cellare]